MEHEVVSTDEGGETPPIISRASSGRRDDTPAGRVLPGQYATGDFPVVSAGPTPHTSRVQRDFSIVGEADEPRRWTCEEFWALPSEEVPGPRRLAAQDAMRLEERPDVAFTIASNPSCAVTPGPPGCDPSCTRSARQLLVRLGQGDHSSCCG